MNDWSLRTADAVGAGLAAAAAGWAFVAAGGLTGDALSAAVLMLTALTVFFGARWVSGRGASVVPALVAIAPLVIAAVRRAPLAGDGPLGYENASAALYLLSCAGALLLARSAGTRPLRVAAWSTAALAAVLVVLTGSEAASLLVCAMLVVGALVRTRTALHRLLGGGAVIVAAAIVTTAMLGMAYEGDPRSGALDRTVDATLGDLRPMVWSTALEQVRSDPFTGVGPGQFAEASTAVAQRPSAAWAHSAYLQAAAETGVAGLLLLVGLMVWAGHRLWHATCVSSASIAGVALVGVALHASIEYVLQFPPVVLGLAAVAGAGSAAPPAGHPPREADDLVPSRGLSGARLLAIYTTALAAVLLLPFAPLNPVHTTLNGALREPDGVRFAEPGLVRSPDVPRELYQALMDAGSFSVVLEVTPASLVQDGPARMLSSSEGTSHRNLTLGQDAGALAVRLRTPASNLNATDTEIVVPGVFTRLEARHLAVTHDERATRVYVDGRIRHEETRGPGGLGTWNFHYPLVLGNEVGGQRPWLGTLHRAAIYDEVLGGDEVARLHGDAGSTRARPLASYTFAGQGASVRDRSARPPRTDLVLPTRFEVEPPPVTESFFADPIETYGLARTVSLAIVHAALFAGFAALLWTWLRVERPVVATVAAIGASAALAAVIEYLQHTQGRSPSAIGVVGAATGALAGTSAIGARRSRRPSDGQRG